MKRTLKCVKFELSILLRSSLIFLSIYIFSYTFLAIIFSMTSSDGSSNMGLIFVAPIFIFVNFMAYYKYIFNNLLLFGNTRNAIMSSLYISVVVFSVGFALLSVLSDYLNVALSNIMNFKFFNLLDQAYGSVNDFEKFLLFFTIMLLLSAAGLLYGALQYKIGRVFTVIFWVILGFSSMLLSLIQALNAVTVVLDSIKWYIGVGVSNGILHMSLHFFVTAVIFGGIAYLIARRQPQNT